MRSARLAVFSAVPVAAAGIGWWVAGAVTSGTKSSAALMSPAAMLPHTPTASAEPIRPSCPAEMVQLDGFCIDRYEAQLVTAQGKRLPHNQRPPEGGDYRASSQAGVRPQGYISRDEATTACANAGKRLCDLTEWRRACQGTERRVFPYGMRAQPGRCNHGKTHLPTTLFGPLPQWSYEAHFNNPRLNVEPGFLAKTGAHRGCASSDGVYDLVGNLHEWVSDPVTPVLMTRFVRDKISRLDQPWRSGHGLFVGGFYSTSHEHGLGCYYVTVAHPPSYHDYSTGFRCCRNASAPQAHAPTNEARRR